MVPKRHLGEGGSDFPSRSKRPNLCSRDLGKDSFQEVVSKLEGPLRNWVRQEFEGALSLFLRASHTGIDSCPDERIFQLHFVDNLPATLFTGCRVESEKGTALKIELRDARSGKVITSGPESSAKVTLRVLDGDFNKEDRENWAREEFDGRTVQQREGRRPLVTGTLVVSLKGGVCGVEDISFTDNSSWTRSGKFRLGATTSEGSIREGVSNVFKVKDHRGESYKKHDRPCRHDEVWRLKKIAKDGASHKRLASYGIVNVEGFLRLYVTDPNSLRKILSKKISDKAWNTIVQHATGCLIDKNELYQYKDVHGTLLVLNSIFQVDGVIFAGEQYRPLEMLNPYDKVRVESLKSFVYKNLNCVVPIENDTFVARQIVLEYMQMTYDNPSLGCIAPQNLDFPNGQGQYEIQFNQPPPAHSYETEGNQLNSILSGGLINSNSYDSLPSDGYGWEASTSEHHLGFAADPLPANSSFQVESSPWPGNGLFEYPRNPALGVLSSDIGIHISSSGKPKARWCKIRAVIKWRMIKSSCRKYGKAPKYASY